MTQELLTDLRSRINPAYQDVLGTESYERKQCADAIEALLDRLEKAEKDADRYQWLRERYTAVNFDLEESGQQAVIFTADDFPIATASCDETIDRAMEASK